MRKANDVMTDEQKKTVETADALCRRWLACLGAIALFLIRRLGLVARFRRMP